jgi:4-alpha-glucanotransferase
LFQLNEGKIPKEVAGCPPDGFSADGQLWGNPLFDWGYMEEHGFSWWIERIRYLCNVYDTLRIDHFRGFDAYYAIPYGDTTAQNGYWKQGPGMKLFNAVERAIGRQPIIAEDLGHLTDSVRQLLKDSGFPGMKVMEFAFDSRDESGNEYLPHNYIENCVAYAGTHDNDTIMGWLTSADENDVKLAHNYLNHPSDDGFNWAMIKAVLMSVADTAIITMQDIIGLGSEGRINTPSTLGNNWKWRIDGTCINDWLANIIYENTVMYGRLPKNFN